QYQVLRPKLMSHLESYLFYVQLVLPISLWSLFQTVFQSVLMPYLRLVFYHSRTLPPLINYVYHTLFLSVCQEKSNTCSLIFEWQLFLKMSFRTYIFLFFMKNEHVFMILQNGIIVHSLLIQCVRESIPDPHEM